MHRCWSCGKVTGIVGRPSRSDDCPYCRAELRSCRGCRFHDAARSGECSEPRAEPPAEKTKVNFCDFFVAAEIQAPEEKKGWEKREHGWNGGNGGNVHDARAALDKLFSK